MDPILRNAVDGRNPANQLRLVVNPIIFKVLKILGGAGFLPSTVCFIIFIVICLLVANDEDLAVYTCEYL